MGAPAFDISTEDQLQNMLQKLPGHPGCGKELLAFWATFASFDFKPLLAEQKWNEKKVHDLEKIQQRCLEATYPFMLVLTLLGDQWDSNIVTKGMRETDK